MTRLSWCQDSTWHGIPDLYRSHSNGSKLFWAMWLVITISLAAWQISRQIISFSTGSYSTSEIIENLGHLRFPNVTVCNYNRANMSRIGNVNLTEQTLDVLLEFIDEPFPLPSYTDDNTNFTAIYQQFINQLGRKFEYRKILDYLGHSCEVSLLGCWWFGVAFNCCDNVNIITNVFGKCFSVHPPTFGVSVLERSAVGWGSALQLMINPGIEYYSDSVLGNFFADGNVLLINDVPQSFDVIGEISLQPGKHHNIVVKAELSQYVDPDVPLFPMPCSKGVELEFYRGQYSPILCIDDCVLKFLRNFCNCTPDGFGTTLNVTICDADVIMCQQESANLAISYTYFETCTSKCGERCEPTMSYKINVFQTDLSKPKMIRLKNKFNWPGNPEKYIYADMHYDTLGKLIKVTSEKTSLFDLISNIGGQLSLWCGMSFISFVQIIYYACCNCGSSKKATKPLETIVTSR